MANIHCRAKDSRMAWRTGVRTWDGTWPRRGRPTDAGMTVLELLISCSILVILATVALPLERVRVISAKEEMLRYDLREMRDAIDRYHDDAEKGKFQVQAGTENYPPDLETLKDGVQMSAQGTGIFGATTGTTGTSGTSDQSGTSQRIRYLREIPVDPMTGNTDWGLRSVQDDADSTSWGGQDVFDVYSKSQGTALDGTKYSDW
jgi:general secretion pathway protein G